MESMSEKKPTNRTAEISDSIRDNTLRVVDEIAKVQPQVIQSMSKLQNETIETSKNIVKTAFDTQKQIASGLNESMSPQVSEQITRQLNEVTNNFVKATGIYQHLLIGALDAALENAKIYSKTIDAITAYNTNIVNAWTSFWAAQQQQFNRA
jgi:hypothetical protein